MHMKELYNKRIDEKIFYGKSKNDLDVYFMPKKGYTKKHAIFTTNYGSMDSEFVPIGQEKAISVPDGIAHFLEHKLFEEPEENIFDKFSKLGADVNAYTSFNRTAYLFYCTEHFYENLELLIRFVQNPYFTDENVEKEKGIIAQEIKMYEDNSNWKAYFNLLKSMYFQHPIRNDIAGTIESISNISKELLYTAYNTFYHPKNMVLFIVGDLSFNDIMETVNNTEKASKDNVKQIERVFPEEPSQVKEKFIEEKMHTSSPLFTIGFKDINLGQKGEEMIIKNAHTNIVLEILFGSSSRFYNELYEEGLINSSFGSFYTGNPTYGYSVISGESKDPKLAFDKIVQLIKRPVDQILKKDDFHRLKNKTIGEFLMALNSMDFIAGNFIELYFDDLLIIDYLDLMEKIQYDEVIERFENHITEDNLSLSIINPLES